MNGGTGGHPLKGGNLSPRYRGTEGQPTEGQGDKLSLRWGQEGAQGGSIMRRLETWHEGSDFPRCFDTSFRWHLDRERLCLVLGDSTTGAWAYEVDLERCRTSAEALDWIMQVAGKTWATDAVIAGLVRALDDCLSPQAHLCGCGRESGPVNVRALILRGARFRLPTPEELGGIREAGGKGP